MGGRKWTDEELVLLEELTEKYPLETVARRLNRTKEAVFLKRQRIGMGGYMANTDMLTRNTVSKILGIENRTLQYWERKGLKSYRKRPYVMYRQEDIIKYMREHPEDWNAARVTDDTMFMRYKDKRGAFSTVLRENSKRHHSQKPECAYQMLETFFPQAKKLELFARAERDGWDQWGNEL